MARSAIVRRDGSTLVGNPIEDIKAASILFEDRGPGGGAGHPLRERAPVGSHPEAIRQCFTYRILASAAVAASRTVGLSSGEAIRIGLAGRSLLSPSDSTATTTRGLAIDNEHEVGFPVRRRSPRSPIIAGRSMAMKRRCRHAPLSTCGPCCRGKRSAPSTAPNASGTGLTRPTRRSAG